MSLKASVMKICSNSIKEKKTIEMASWERKIKLFSISHLFKNKSELNCNKGHTTKLFLPFHETITDLSAYKNKGMQKLQKLSQITFLLSLLALWVCHCSLNDWSIINDYKIKRPGPLYSKIMPGFVNCLEFCKAQH